MQRICRGVLSRRRDFSISGQASEAEENLDLQNNIASYQRKIEWDMSNMPKTPHC